MKKLTEQQIDIIWAMYNKWCTQYEIATELWITQQTVSNYLK